jgi:hypothetical protein
MKYFYPVSQELPKRKKESEKYVRDDDIRDQITKSF